MREQVLEGLRGMIGYCISHNGIGLNAISAAIAFIESLSSGALRSAFVFRIMADSTLDARTRDKVLAHYDAACAAPAA